MPSNHLILCRPLFLLPWVFPSIRVFSDESVTGPLGQPPSPSRNWAWSAGPTPIALLLGSQGPHAWPRSLTPCVLPIQLLLTRSQGQGEIRARNLWVESKWGGSRRAHRVKENQSLLTWADTTTVTPPWYGLCLGPPALPYWLHSVSSIGRASVRAKGQENQCPRANRAVPVERGEESGLGWAPAVVLLTFQIFVCRREGTAFLGDHVSWGGSCFAASSQSFSVRTSRAGFPGQMLYCPHRLIWPAPSF